MDKNIKYKVAKGASFTTSIKTLLDLNFRNFGSQEGVASVYSSSNLTLRLTFKHK